MLNEEVKLKEKINKLIDKIAEIENCISEKNTHIKILEEEIKILKVKENCSGSQNIKVDENESEIFSFIRDFCLIARMLIQNDDYIKYSYETKFSGSFYKIERTVFENYVCEYAKMDLKAFLNFCIDLELIKSEPNRKCIYGAGSQRVYYVSRPFIETANRNTKNVEIVEQEA